MTDKNSIVIKDYLDSNNLEKINEILLPINDKIKKIYSYVFEDESEFTDFFSKNYLNIVKDYFLTNPKAKFNSYYNKIIGYKLNDIVRKIIEEGNLDIILNRFIKKKILKKNNMTFDEYVMELEKIELFFLKLDIIPNIDEVIKILINNKKINTIISAIFLNKNIENQVEYNQIIDISESNYVLALLEEYCKKYNIKIINNNTSIVTNKKEYESNYLYNHKSLDSTGMYLKEISMINLLTPLEEFKLLKKYAETKDKLAEKRIVEANLRLVVNIVRRKYKSLDIDFLDLIQYGNLGLYGAVKKYDIKSGYRFSTYATNWIEQSIRRYTANECDSIRVPTQVKANYIKYKLVKSSLEKDLGREASVVEMSEALGWTIKKVTELLEIYPQISSLNMDISDDNKGKELSDFIPSSEIVEDIVIDNLVKKELREKIEIILSRIVSEKNKEIFLYRNGLITGRYETLEDTGKRYNLSRERVRKIEKKVFWILRHSVDGKKLAYYLDDPEQALINLGRIKKSSASKNSKKLSYKKAEKIVSKPKTNLVEEPKPTTVYTNQEPTENIHFSINQSGSTPIKNYQSNVMTESQKKRFLEASLSTKSSQEVRVESTYTKALTPTNKPKKQSLKILFDKVPEDIMDKLIEQLSDEEKMLISKRENGPLTKKEQSIYNCSIEKIKGKLALEVQNGLLKEDILSEYGIKPYQRKARKNKAKENSTNTKESPVTDLISSIKQDNQGNIPLDTLKQRLLYLVKNQNEAKLNDLELVFKEIFDESLLTDELNPKMYCYIGLRFGYFDGKTYSNKAIETVLCHDDIKYCKENIKLCIKYELANYRKIKDESKAYQKNIKK